MKSDKKCAVVGIDVGTSGVRGVAVSPAGELLAEADEKIRQDRRAAGESTSKTLVNGGKFCAPLGRTLSKA